MPFPSPFSSLQTEPSAHLDALAWALTMPICKSSPAAGTSSKKNATDISADHVTEAAQVKRTREQAYFNSYDFDAIEVLPYDEEEEEGEEDSRPVNPSATALPAGINKFAYLQRLGAIFGHKEGGATAAAAANSADSAPSAAPSPPAAAAGQSSSSSSDNFLLPRAMLKYQYQR